MSFLALLGMLAAVGVASVVEDSKPSNPYPGNTTEKERATRIFEQNIKRVEKVMKKYGRRW